MKVRVVRSFFFGGTIRAPGEVIECSDSFGYSMLYERKAEPVADTPPPARGPMMVRSEPALVPPVVAPVAPPAAPAPLEAAQSAPQRRPKGVPDAGQ